MFTESYQVSEEEAKILNIEELVKNSEGLTLKLKISESEVGQLKLVVKQLEGEKLALIVKLEDASNEIGRLDMVLKHQIDNLESIRRLPPLKP